MNAGYKTATLSQCPGGNNSSHILPNLNHCRFYNHILQTYMALDGVSLTGFDETEVVSAGKDQHACTLHSPRNKSMVANSRERVRLLLIGVSFHGPMLSVAKQVLMLLLLLFVSLFVLLIYRRYR